MADQRHRAALAAALAVCALAGACASAPSASAPSASAAPGSPPPGGGRITVLAAASLTEAFTTLGDRFEAAHPGATVTFSFAASSTLATQITAGAPADVFASAGTEAMDAVTAARRVDPSAPPSLIARTTMAVAVPAANPARITALADLARPRTKLALCAPTVPCGAAARTVLAKAGLTVTPVTEEANVKAVLTTVRLGEVDAGIVYVTDVHAAGAAVRHVPVPDAVNTSVGYPLAVLAHAPNPVLAREFVAFVRSAEGTAALTAAGFTRP
ncbi:MAG: molybdate transport system substrate-binding protein [Actinomycetota bacterium]|nr:molybdate transport system substrate-binding protein [Actinomycetota bacterium]